MTEIPILPTSKLLFKRATLCDIPTLLRIINAAYRSNHKNSWTNEAHLVKDPRISTEGLVRVVNSPEECLIVAFRPNVGNDDDIVGCICLEQCNDDGELIAGANQVLLGLFAVDPEIQSQGIGRFLIEVCMIRSLNLLLTSQALLMNDLVGASMMSGMLNFCNDNWFKTLYRDV